MIHDLQRNPERRFSVDRNPKRKRGTSLVRRSSLAYASGYDPVLTPPRRRAGFTLLEIMLVAGLTGLLFVMISGIWTGFGRALSDTIAHARVVGEANLAVETLRRDLGGNLPGEEVGPRDRGRVMGRLNVGGTQLRICFEGEPVNGLADWVAPDKVISYSLQNGQLLRVDEQSGESFVVAENVSNFGVTDQADGVTVDLDITYRDFTRSYTLVAKDP